MEKNVGSVDIEELKRAREALNEERGIENDPNMYNSYNPDRNNDSINDEEEQPENFEADNQPENFEEDNQSENIETDEQSENFENVSDNQSVDVEDLIEALNSESQSSDESDSTENVVEENSVQDSLQENENSDLDADSQAQNSSSQEQKDFDVYDKFSAFEVAPQNSTEEFSKQQENIEEKEDLENLGESNENQEQEESSSNEIDSNELEEIAQNMADSTNEIGEETEQDDNAEKNENDLSSLGTIDFDSMKTDSDEKSNANFDEDSNEIEEKNMTDSEEETDSIDSDTENVAQETVPETNLENQVYNENEINKSADDSANDNEKEEIQTNQYNTEVIDNYKKLENLDKLISDEEQSIPELDIKKPKIEYADIEPFEFVDLISTEEFKNSDKISYILGKDETGKVCYGNLRDLYNIAIFGKESNSVISLVHSIIISLILKNSVTDINFVICDSKADSKFEVYDKSTYMYFNRIAKTNKEILDSLIELTKELEERYKLLASTGVKSIEQYNIIAKNDNLKPLPYLLLVYNNYSKSSQLTEADKINACLYQLLKLGRCVGMYEIVIANSSIKSDEINYNLPTRISFMSDDEDDSLRTFGEVGAEQLPSSNDFLCSSIDKNKVVHLRVANITKSEIEVLIESINE